MSSETELEKNQIVERSDSDGLSADQRRLLCRAHRICSLDAGIRRWLVAEAGLDSLTPLHHAIFSRDPDTVSALLEAGADTEAKTRLPSRYTDGSVDGGVTALRRDGRKVALSDDDKYAPAKNLSPLILPFQGAKKGCRDTGIDGCRFALSVLNIYMARFAFSVLGSQAAA